MNDTFEPHCAPCYNYMSHGKEEKKTVWIVPHIVRHAENNVKIITWRCNWGQTCEAAGCIYARKMLENGR